MRFILLLLKLLLASEAICQTGDFGNPLGAPQVQSLQTLRLQENIQIHQQNNMMMIQLGCAPPGMNVNYKNKQAQIQELKDILWEDSVQDALYGKGSIAGSKMNYSDPRSRAKDENFNKAFDQLRAMLQGGKYSFKDAVFITERAYEPSLSYQQYNSSITAMASSCKSMAMKNPKFKTDKNLVLSWAIKKFMVDTIPVQQAPKKLDVNFTYDFEDIFGDDDIRQLFVSKLMGTRKGNCHSLPYLYKIIAGELGIGDEAHLAYAPNHVYIRQKFDDVWWNCELTSGQFLQDWYLMATGYVHVPGIQGKIYMTPLDEKESIAACVMDLEQYYEAKYGLDNFALKCTELALENYPNCIQAQLVKANYWNLALRYNMKQSGITDVEQARNYESTKHCLEQLEATSKTIKEKGYVPVPKEKYQQWLESMRKEKERRETLKEK
jgi:hypothetical protein